MRSFLVLDPVSRARNLAAQKLPLLHEQLLRAKQRLLANLVVRVRQQPHRAILTLEVLHQEPARGIVRGELAEIVTNHRERPGLGARIARGGDEHPEELAVVIRQLGRVLAPKALVGVRGGPVQRTGRDFRPVPIPRARLLAPGQHSVLEVGERGEELLVVKVPKPQVLNQLSKRQLLRREAHADDAAHADAAAVVPVCRGSPPV
mmetsp:Transcript_7047/g.32172  ORF Transcript_7047/g.32172 Transcript_7047/m.32172 type:complete len:205 (-) Transcript_7047:42-656(-)